MGAGHSQEKKGDTPSVTDVWQDISQVVDAVKQDHKGVIYLCGHSSGAAELHVLVKKEKEMVTFLLHLNLAINQILRGLIKSLLQPFKYGSSFCLR
ncbi:serine aminopeptidase domain-containing protein [Bacillus safensis]|uniref:serine aminopeptidase domain-containing protein n=1 Tax=Bacillus safensis TaxID=561879 RepID=UPI0038197826